MRTSAAALAAALALAGFAGNASAALAPATTTIVICTAYGMQQITLDKDGRPVPAKRQGQTGPCHAICCERRLRGRT